MKKLRIYCDTSVFGGCFDPEFREASNRLFREFQESRAILVLSDITLQELKEAPPQVKNLLAGIPATQLEMIEESEEIVALRDAYLRAGILGPASIEDASHVATASIAAVDLIVSWNFKHIVRYNKIRQYHAINLLEGYPIVAIHSPNEVAGNEERL
jgi:hypothetical protein